MMGGGVQHLFVGGECQMSDAWKLESVEFFL
jgi:hypothetical protein